MKLSRCASLILLVVLMLSACGGGTSGSGVTTYEGRVASTEGDGLSGVSVVIESTGDGTVTDQQGLFALQSEAHGSEVPFLLESPKFRNRFVLNDIPESGSRVTVDVTVDT